MTSGQRPGSRDPLKRALFLGSKNYGWIALRALREISPGSLIGIVTQDDSGDPRSRFAEISSFASACDIPLRVIVKTSELRQAVRDFGPEVCITVGWFAIIPEDILLSVPEGFVGIHNSLLPALRGSAPLVWAILKGDSKAGITLFKFGPGLDDGDILGSHSFPIGPEDYIADLMNKAEKAVTPLIRETYPKILNNSLVGIPQAKNDPRITYGAPRRPLDGNIDWSKSAEYIYNFIRAQAPPYPGAFTFLQNQKMIIRRAILFPPVYYGTPGQVAQIGEEGVYVICGDHRALVVEDIELRDVSEAVVYQGHPGEIIKSVAIRFANRIQES